MQSVIAFYLPVIVTFAVAFTSGYLIGMFRGYGQAVRDSDAPSEPWR